MADISERLQSLSPEKRDMLMRMMQPQQGRGLDQGVAARPDILTKRPFAPSDQNYTLKLDSGGGGDLGALGFETCPRATLKPKQVEIQVSAVSLNFRDVMTATGMYPQASAEPMLGDCAGRIAAVGEGVREDLRVGDEVIALAQEPYSGFAKTWASGVIRKPASMSFAEGSTVPTVYLTTYFSLRHLGRLAKGERVLVHSAAGGVGLAALQYAQWAGAEVVATAGTPEKREYLRSLGVELVADSRNPNFDEEIKDLTRGEGVDVVLNSLAGDAIPKGLRLLRPLGRFIELGKRDIFGNGKLDFSLFRKFITFAAVDLGTLSVKRFFPALFAEVIEMFERGAFTVPPFREYAVGDIGEAFKYMSRSQHIGKIVLRVEGEQVLVTDGSPAGVWAAPAAGALVGASA